MTGSVPVGTCEGNRKAILAYEMIRIDNSSAATMAHRANKACAVINRIENKDFGTFREAKTIAISIRAVILAKPRAVARLLFKQRTHLCGRKRSRSIRPHRGRGRQQLSPHRNGLDPMAGNQQNRLT